MRARLTPNPPPYEAVASGPHAQGDLIILRSSIDDDADRQKLETVRLQKFLGSILKEDYCIHEKSNFADYAHFNALGAILICLEHTYDLLQLVGSEHDALIPYLRRHFHLPCAALGLSVQIVAPMILRYHRHREGWRWYHGCILGLLRDAPPATLATKFYIDRTLLIPKLLASDSLATSEALKKLHSIQNLWFERVDGPKEEATLQNLADLTYQTPIAYELNGLGQTIANSRERKAREIAQEESGTCAGNPNSKPRRSFCDWLTLRFDLSDLGHAIRYFANRAEDAEPKKD